MAKNKTMLAAKEAKNDEFYTLWNTIEKELKNYPGKFVGKSIVSPCDEPAHSNFVRWYYYNFLKEGVKEYCATHYEGNSTRAPQTYFIRNTNDAVEELIFPQGGLVKEMAVELVKKGGMPFEMFFEKWRADEMEERIMFSPDGIAKLKKRQ